MNCHITTIRYTYSKDEVEFDFTAELWYTWEKDAVLISQYKERGIIYPAIDKVVVLSHDAKDYPGDEAVAKWIEEDIESEESHITSILSDEDGRYKKSGILLSHTTYKQRFIQQFKNKWKIDQWSETDISRLLSEAKRQRIN